MITPGRYSSGWESGCGAADPSLSKISTTAYAGTGYGTQAPGTINRGISIPVSPGVSVPQVRFFLGTDGNLYALTNGINGLNAFVIPPTLVPVQPPTSYPPTHN